ncbi:MAG: N-acetylmuramic acid 6-phosphate etherase [Verrucomicrobia bacterium]|nr:N-acetylmuramic acid 6-phosphate etherase [Verrucomicrobiota bacterium]
MNQQAASRNEPLVLGIECGGTRTVALLARGTQTIQRIEGGPANLRLVSDTQLLRHFRQFRRALPCPDALGIGMAGARTSDDLARILRCAGKLWPRVPCWTGHDLEVGLAAAEKTRANVRARVLVLSGTGSCCFGQSTTGQTAKIGGWGHILGDKGSGFEIGLRALKAVVFYLDRDDEWSALGQRILRALQLNEPNDLIGWVQRASKTEIAALAPAVFAAVAERDRIASDILKGAAHSLAKDAASCARRVAKASQRVEFIFAGGVLLRQPRFAQSVKTELRKLWPAAVARQLKRESVWGAVELARAEFASRQRTPRLRESTDMMSPAEKRRPEIFVPLTASLSPTEQRHPRSMNLDKLSVNAAIELMLSEEARLPGKILAERNKIARVVDWIVRALRAGGRLFYVGAGTSGRIGVLDASECPPTFRTQPEQVQGIIAGGQRALWAPVEGAEDDVSAGARAIEFRSIGRHDVVIGIAASGGTPFVWGALGEAKARRARTILLCFNPTLGVPPKHRPDLIIAPDIGPEILTGSTRLKAGTATKLLLNLFTTLAMVRLGKVVSNLMVDVHPANRKLRERAVRILRELTNASEPAARQALENSRWVIKAALKKIPRKNRDGRLQS